MNYRELKEKIQSSFDLIYFPDYRCATDEIQATAREMFDNGENIDKVLIFCKRARFELAANKYKQEASLSKRFQSRTFDNFVIETETQRNAYNKAKEYAQNIDKILKDGTGIIFAGNGCVGTGKTHLACAIANDLLNRGYPVKVVNVTKMIATIKEDFKIDEYLNAPILLIDDLGKETGTQWVCETLYTIFNERYEAMKPTIITTENGLEDIRKNYVITINDQIIDRGKSIISRLTEDFIYIPLTGSDYRQRRAA